MFMRSDLMEKVNRRKFFSFFFGRMENVRVLSSVAVIRFFFFFGKRQRMERYTLRFALRSAFDIFSSSSPNEHRSAIPANARRPHVCWRSAWPIGRIIVALGSIFRAVGLGGHVGNGRWKVHTKTFLSPLHVD